ncbi:unnamed protein product [Prorocentrum cordatum]|uniref:Uncharacterized protein n=1 Tax=Prorocentrum cordatum TaxID=2364126 RepID=A0ABN9R8D5_9DINO|nr:unnamed protein product [Polarella glacialis]
MVSVSPRPLVENRLVLIAAAIFVGLIAFGPTPSFAQDGEQVSGAPSGELHRILIPKCLVACLPSPFTPKGRDRVRRRRRW